MLNIPTRKGNICEKNVNVSIKAGCRRDAEPKLLTATIKNLIFQQEG